MCREWTRKDWLATLDDFRNWPRIDFSGKRAEIRDQAFAHLPQPRELLGTEMEDHGKRPPLDVRV